MNLISVLLLVVIAMISTPLARAAGKQESLIVGMELAYPPFEMTDENGTPTGVSGNVSLSLARSPSNRDCCYSTNPLPHSILK